MPRSSAQSDFVVRREAPVALPPAALLVSLPEAPVHQASALATRWVLRATIFLLVVFAALCAIGPHIPSGE